MNRLEATLAASLALVATAVLLTGCGGNGEPAANKPAEPAAACAKCLSEDFSAGAETRWPTVNDDRRQLGLTADGAYAAQLNITGFTLFGPDQFDAAGNRLHFADSTVSVQARVMAGDPAVGLLCRWNDETGLDSTQGYAFSVKANHYSVFLFTGDGAPKTLARGDLPAGTDLTQPTQLEASCVGERLSFAVDGTTVATVNDSAIASGSDGLLLALNSDDTTPASALYDDYRVR
jgi:hypothetical protein